MPPASVQLNQLTSDTDVFVYTEVSNLTLSTDLHVDAAVSGTYTSPFVPGGTISAGTTVNSYLMHSDPASAFPVNYNDRTLTFNNEQIVGLILLSSTLTGSTAVLGAPGTAYPPPPNNWGLELGLEPDSIVWSGSTITWNTLTGGGHDSGGEDNIRILTVVVVPEAETGWMVFGGLLSILILRRSCRSGVGQSL